MNEVLKPAGSEQVLETLIFVYMRDNLFSTSPRIINLNLTKGTHGVLFVEENYSDSPGCPPPTIFLKLI